MNRLWLYRKLLRNHCRASLIKFRIGTLPYTEEEEKKVRDLQEAYKKIVKARIDAMPKCTIYSFGSDRWTFDLFGFVILTFDARGNSGMGSDDSFVIVGHYSD